MIPRRRSTTLHWLLAGLLLLLLPALPAMPVRAASYTVTSTADDSSAGTLRYAINQVNAGSFDTIDFDSSVTGTILLTGGLPQLARNVTINGPGADKLAVDGATLYRPFTVASTVTAATISGLTIRHGHDALWGGGIYNDGKLTVTSSTLSDNTASGTGFGQGGGAIINRPGRSLTVTNSTFFHNSSAYGGGAIEVYQSTGTPYSVTVTNSTFSNNSAPGGGAIEAWNGGTLTVTNSTFSGNSASDQGGAIYKTFEGQMTLTNDTFAGNSAGSAGGGIRNTGPATLTNMIVATNTAPTGPDIYGGSGSAGHNLIGNGSGANGATNGVNGDLVGTSANPIDPLLGILSDNGGPTQTIPLLPGSPAINAGAPVGGSVPSTDQRGTSRVGTPDIGAFESQGFTLTKTGGDNQSTDVDTAFTSPLAVAIAPVNAGEPVNGGQVTFTGVPNNGASATFGTRAGCTNGTDNLTTVCTIAGGTATTPTVTANGTAGGFTVTAAAAGATTQTFNLTNKAAAPTDTTPPTTTASPAGTAGNAPWYTSAVTVTLSAQDNPGGSGVAATYYTLDNGSAQTYAGPFQVASDGVHTLAFWSVDKANNTEQHQQQSLSIDTTPPTGVTGTPERAADSNGWYNHAVKVTFSGQDATSGLASCTSTTYSGPDSATASASGTCTDKAGNTSASATFALKYDATKPTVTYTGNAGMYTVDQTVNITCTAADNLSGVAKTTCKDITGLAYSFTPGTNKFEATAMDTAGNTGTGTTSFTVTVTATSFDAVIAKLVSDPSVAASLQEQVKLIVAAPNAKTKANQVNAFIKLVNAQRGKSITAENAAILIKLVNAL